MDIYKTCSQHKFIYAMSIIVTQHHAPCITDDDMLKRKITFMYWSVNLSRYNDIQLLDQL